MEELSTSVQNAQDEDDVISQTQEKRDEAVNLLAVKKKEKSQWSLFQLYMVCAEKICSKDLEEQQNSCISVNEAIFKGVAKVVHRYRSLFNDLEVGLTASHKDMRENAKET